MQYCMSTGLVNPRGIGKPEVRIIQGDLNDEMFKRMPEVEVVVVNGNVCFTTNNPIILPQMIVLGDMEVKNLCLMRGLTVTGKCVAQHVSCSGDLIVGPGSIIKDYHVHGGVVAIGT